MAHLTYATDLLHEPLSAHVPDLQRCLLPVITAEHELSLVRGKAIEDAQIARDDHVGSAGLEKAHLGRINQSTK